MGGELSNNVAVSSDMREYFNKLQKEIDICYDIANKARKKGFDPEFETEIPQALDLAARVEQLVGPKDIAPKIRAATKKIGNRELTSLEIAKEIVKEKKYKFRTKEDALDQAVRTGLAILTEGVLVAPLEGIAEVKLGKNKDGTDYVDLYFSGPIRSAGGTGQAMSVLIADVVRREIGIGKFQPTEGEIERYKEEIPLYKRVQHLQYTPSVDEIDKIVRGCPICINGEGTEDEEVTGYRDLPRVSTNRLRGGACLVIAEGLCLKAPKILKHVKKLKLENWNFLDIFASKTKELDGKKEGTIPKILPSSKYIGDVIAGRPVFSHPSRKGGFRLRYGRGRTCGLASTAINPASMYLLDDFVAVGTQLKTERPGKGTIGTPCSEIEGPIVLLQNGDLIQVNDIKNIKNIEVKKIIDLGEILVPFGEFIENNALLPDSGYVYEWWVQDLQKKIDCLPKEYCFTEVSESEEKTINKIIKDFGRDINLKQPSFDDALELSKKYDIALHPYYNLFWHDITVKDLQALSNYIKEHGSFTDSNLILPKDNEIKRILVELGAPHKQGKEALIFDRYSQILIRCCGLELKENKIIETERFEVIKKAKDEDDIILLVSKLADLTIKPRSPFRIGTRMGRPEKAAARKMRPPPHVLFPIGNYGGNQRLIRDAADLIKIDVEAGVRICPECRKKTHRLFCTCGKHTECFNGKIEIQEINLAEEIKLAQKNVDERTLPATIKGVIGTISKNKTPEPLEKGILRAKHNVPVFKDGTIRFDMTDAPITHFKPREIGVTINRLRDLGYKNDYLGNELVNEDQICELKVQDVIISKACAEFFVQVTRFIDDLLVKFYKMKSFYNIKKLNDLVGHLVVGLAPHTSAGALSRIIGFVDAQVCYAHPFYHAAKRRNCLSPDTNITFVDSKIPKLTNIEKFYCDIKSDEKVVDDFGTKQKTVEGIKTLAFNISNCKTELKNINSVYKIKAPKHLLKVKLKSGRNFIASYLHRVVVYSNGKIQTKKIVELKHDDKFLISQNISLVENDIQKIDLLSEFLQIRYKNKDIVIRGIEKFVRKCIQKLGGLEKTSFKLKINKKTFSNYIYRDSIPLSIFLKLLEVCNDKIDSIPKNCFLGVKRNHSVVPRIINVNDQLMRIFGYYLSEGYARFTKKSCYQISFACTEEDMRNDIIKCIKDVFQIQPYTDKHCICISNRIIHDFFVYILNIGTNAKNKRIPSRFTALPKNKIKELLRAYFSGDGSVEKNRLHVTCSSVNRKLLYDIGMQLLRFGIFYRCKEEIKKANGVLKKFYEKKNKSPVFKLYYISIRSSHARKFFSEIGFSLRRKQIKLESVISNERKPRLNIIGDFVLDELKEITPIKSNSEYIYDIEVENLHNFPINDYIVSNNSDGDEDGLMLLLDALLNFSHSYIPDKRGGKMDLPLILTIRIDPSEVDKEAHNIDTLARYPLDFYEATLRHENAKELEGKMGLVSSRLGTELQYEKFGFTHDTYDISEGPKISTYKTLKSMMDKMNAQLNLAAKIRAVDEADVAYKVIERHFLPDIVGNMRAFSKQSVRCPTCNIVYRRPPLSGVCIKCNGKLTLTVHEKSVKKYLEISKEIAKRYNISSYAQQRIILIEKSIDSLFISDKVKTTKLTDFL